MHVCSVANVDSQQRCRHHHHHHSNHSNHNNHTNHPKTINWNHSDPNTVCYHPKLDHAVHFNQNTITTVVMVFAMCLAMVGVKEIKTTLIRPKIVNRNVAMYKIYAVYHQFVAVVKRM